MRLLLTLTLFVAGCSGDYYVDTRDSNYDASLMRVDQANYQFHQSQQLRSIESQNRDAAWRQTELSYRR